MSALFPIPWLFIVQYPSPRLTTLPLLVANGGCTDILAQTGGQFSNLLTKATMEREI